MNRREVLLLLAGTGALPDQLLAIGRTVHKRVRAGTLRALNAHQNETVATIAELIIPKTDTAGAREAGVPAFIDVMLADWADDDHRQQFTAGLANVDERARGLFAKDFVALVGRAYTSVVYDGADGRYFLTSDAERSTVCLKRLLSAAGVSLAAVPPTDEG